MEQLRVVGVRAMADLGDSMFEVSGTVVIRATRRLSDFANHPDPMLELDEARMRHHRPAGAEEWTEVEGLSLNRDRILLLLPFDDMDPGADPSLVVNGRQIRVQVICRRLRVTGFVSVPLQATISSFIHETKARFMALKQARVVPETGAFEVGDFGGTHDFCLINRDQIVACIETRSRLHDAGALGSGA